MKAIKEKGRKIVDATYTAQQKVISQLRLRMKMNTFIVSFLIMMLVLLMAIIVWLIWR